jgi:hypothetical protein
MTTDEQDILIDGAIRGELKTAQQQEFYNLVTTNTEVKKNFQFRLHLKLAMQVEQKKKLNTFFSNQLRNTYSNKNSKVISLNLFWKKSLWAASIIIILGITLYYKKPFLKEMQSAKIQNPIIPKKISLPITLIPNVNLGFAGKQSNQDSLSILFFYDAKKDAEYLFTDTLKLYGNIDLKNVNIQLNLSKQYYIFTYGNQSQILVRFTEKNILLKK